MSRYKQNKALAAAADVERKIGAAAGNMSNFIAAVSAAKAAREAYDAAEVDDDERTATKLDLASDVAASVNHQVPLLAIAFDTIAGFMMDAEGNPLTRQNLLDLLAAAPAAE